MIFIPAILVGIVGFLILGPIGAVIGVVLVVGLGIIAAVNRR